MKKILMLLAGVVLATGFYTQSQSVSAATTETTSAVVNDDPDESDVTDVTIEQYLENISGIEDVTGQKLLSLIRSDDTYILFVGYKECPYCREFSKILKDYKTTATLPLYYVNLDDAYTDVTQDELIEINSFFQTQVKLSGTPTIAKITNKVADPVFVGSETTLEQLESLSAK